MVFLLKMKFNSKCISFIDLIIALEYGQELLGWEAEILHCVSGTEELQFDKTLFFPFW